MTKKETNKILIVCKYISLGMPIIGLSFFLRGMDNFVIDDINRLWMILVTLGIFAYSMNSYWNNG